MPYFEQEMAEERAQKEADRYIDQASSILTSLQRNVMPNFGNSLIVFHFHIKFCFSLMLRMEVYT
jgi:hypothetical protein